MSYIMLPAVCIVIVPRPNTTTTIRCGPSYIDISYREEIGSDQRRILPKESNGRSLRRMVEEEFEDYDPSQYTEVFR